MDTVGFLLQCAEDIPLLLAALAPGDGWKGVSPASPRFVFLRGPQWDKARPETLDTIAHARESFLRGGATVAECESSSSAETLRQSAWTILSFENAQNWAYEHDFRRSSLSPTLAAHLDRAATISRAGYGAALAAADAARRDIDAILTTCDAILTAAVPGEAPAGLASTGDSVFNGAWTLAHAPCVTLPVGSGPKGLPVGIQLIGRRGGDAALAALARWAEARLAPIAPAPAQRSA
jgi:Asp-tRNA(Asn)/Glu-tRNA(Gln) amidotransferase A subunit family amidase